MELQREYDVLYKSILDEHCQVFERLSMVQLQQCMDAIQAAGRIFVMGAGREGISCRAFAMLLAHLGKTVYWVWDDTTVGMKKGDLLIVCDGRGGIGMFRYILERAKATGARILMVSGLPNGENCQIYADILLFVHATVFLGKKQSQSVPKQQDVPPTIQLMGNQFEQHLYLLFDILIMLLQRQMGITAHEMEARHRNIE